MDEGSGKGRYWEQKGEKSAREWHYRIAREEVEKGVRDPGGNLFQVSARARKRGGGSTTTGRWKRHLVELSTTEGLVAFFLDGQSPLLEVISFTYFS